MQAPWTPTITEQTLGAISPIPFAALSFLSSSYVVYHLLWKERQNLKRLYHRLILAMNFAELLASSTWFWSPAAVPKGTPNFYGAAGTIQTCTASGIVHMIGSLAVPTYYVALSLNAFMGIRNKFREETYQWIEKFIHAIAWCFPLVISIIAILTENVNPHFPGGCSSLSQAPQGCAENPDVPCQRGKQIKYLTYIIGVGLCFVYFIFPPTILITMFRWIKKIEVKISGNVGMQQLREQARSQMLKSMAIQISIYLFLFWFVWVPNFGVLLYETITGKMPYGLDIFTNCLQAMHGFVLAGVYFTLPVLVARQQQLPALESKSNTRTERTVEDIRADAAREPLLDSEPAQENKKKVTFIFNIFDGTPDEDSPWAAFLEVSQTSIGASVVSATP